jgi:nitrogen fixation NifU-like protein
LENQMAFDLDDFAETVQADILREARKVYSEEVIRRWQNPPHFEQMENPDGYAKIKGPCGDTIEIFLSIKETCITRATFTTDGCASSLASASMACDLALGKSLAELYAVGPSAILDALGGLPEKDQHCPLLAANALRAAAVNCRELLQQPWKKIYRH